MKNTIIYLIGNYGVGKLTVAKQVCAQTDAKLVDNHLINNVVFSLLRKDGATPMPDAVWDLTWNIREQAVTAMRELCGAHDSFVLTNALREDDEYDQAAYAQILDLAKARDATFVPIHLDCSESENAKRVASPEREASMKMTFVEGAINARKNKPILKFEHVNKLTIENSNLSPHVAAKTIITHAESCA